MNTFTKIWVTCMFVFTGYFLAGTLYAQVSGTNTINSSVANFSGNPSGVSGKNWTTFTNAISALSSYGVSGGPVILNVANGTYTEQITIGSISGVSSTNTVTFQSASGDSTTVTLTSSSSSSTANYTVSLNGASRINFSKMTISNTNTTYGRVIDMSNASTYNNFLNNRIFGIASGSTVDFAVIYSNAGSSSVCSYNTFSNNYILNGYSSVYFYGYSSTSTYYCISNAFLGNTMSNFYTYGVVTSLAQNLQVNNNKMIGASTASKGIYSQNCLTTMQFNGNTITLPGTAAIAGINGINGGAVHQVNNNIITLSGSTVSMIYGIWLQTVNANNHQFNGNTIILSTTGSGGEYGIWPNYLYGETTTTYTQAKNNNIQLIGNTPGTSVGIQWDNMRGYGPGGTYPRDLVANNFISQDNGTGPVYGIHTTTTSSGTGNTDFLYNSISIKKGSTSSYGIFHEGNHDANCNFQNNVVYMGGASGYCGYAVYYSSSSYLTISDYNDFYCPNSPSGYVGYYGGTSYSFSNWYSNTGKDLHSLNVNPLFTSTYNLHLTSILLHAGSATLPTGTVPVPTDIDGDLRSTTTPYIGADEYIPKNLVRIVSATVIQPDTSIVYQGNTNKMIIGIKIKTVGTDTMAKVTRFAFDSAGAFSYSNITGTAKVFYTGNSSTFSTTNLYGNTSGTPSAAFTITGNKTLDTGTVYFWLTFDVSSTATVGAYLDAKCTEVRWDSSGTTLYKTPLITSPQGRRRILAPPKVLNTLAFTQPSTAWVYRNTTNNPVLRLDINVTGTGLTLYLTQVTVAAINTSNADVTYVRLFATTTTTFSTSTQVGTALTFSSGIATFSSLNYSLPTGNTYIWVTYDIPLTAAVFDTVDARIPANGITIGGINYPSTIQNPTGNRVINRNQYDGGIAAITSPVVPYCNSSPSIQVNLKNYGTATLTSDTIRWTVNGSPQSPFPWSGSLSSGSTMNVLLGSYSFTQGTPYTLKVYTSKRLNGVIIDSFPGNDTARAIINVGYIPSPGFSINDTLQCFKNNSFVFTNTTTISSGTFTSYWNFGDMATSTVKSPSHSYLSVNTFPVKLVATSVGGCKDSITKNVSLKPTAAAVFTINDSSQCFRVNSFSFTNNTVISSGTFTNLWKFGDNSTSASFSPTHGYGSIGVYQVRLITTSDRNCKDSIAKNAYVRPHPLTAFVVNDSDQCFKGNSFVFSNGTTVASGIFTSLWKFGDNTTSTSTNPTKSYTGAGSFTVKLIATSGYGCKDSVTGNTYVLPTPVTAFVINDSSQCYNGNAYVFTNNSSISTGSYSSFWNFGDMTTSTSLSPSKSYTGPGIYNVKLINTSNLGCKDSITKKAYVRPNPVTSFNINDSDQCLRLNSFLFTNTTTIVSGTFTNNWKFGDNTTSTALSPVKNYGATGTYTVKLIATSTYGCKDSVSRKVYVLPHPVTKFAINDSVECFKGNSFTFTNNSTIPSGTFTSIWKFGDNTTSTATTPVHSYLSYGTSYTVRLVNTSNYGCKDSASHVVTIYASPQTSFNITYSQPCLKNNVFAFANTSTIPIGSMTFLWKFGDNTTSTFGMGAHSYLTAGTYTVKLIATSDMLCADSTSKTVTVIPQPQAGFTLNDSGLCVKNNLFQFTDNSKITGDVIAAWNWKFGDGASSNVKNTTHAYPTPNTYIFTHIVTSSKGCIDSISANIYVYPLPVAAFTVSDTIQCQKGNSFIFTNGSTSSGYTSYLWVFGDGNTSTSVNDTHSYANSGYYNAMLIVISNSCLDTSEMIIHVKKMPVVNLGKDTIIDDNKSIALDAGSGLDSILWSNNKTSRFIVVDSSGIGYNTSLFWVKVTLNGCIAYDSIVIGFKKHVSVYDPQGNFIVRVYPNPASDYLIIEPGAAGKDCVLTLNDMDGKILREMHVRTGNGTNTCQMDISGLAEGIYFLNVSNREVTKVVKIIKY